ncbi:hypothetical protein FHG87_001769 [Trinorchestia longiramus]|nr:hypothetical protein FHG87_001769 [Trinorchestia longiramus]
MPACLVFVDVTSMVSHMTAIWGQWTGLFNHCPFVVELLSLPCQPSFLTVMRWRCEAVEAGVPRFNVAVTRARALLIVVGCPRLLERDQYWGKLLAYCFENGCYRGCKYDPSENDIEEIEENFKELKLHVDAQTEESFASETNNDVPYS